MTDVAMALYVLLGALLLFGVGVLFGSVRQLTSSESERKIAALQAALANLAEAVMRNGVEMKPVGPGEVDTFELLMQALVEARELAPKQATPVRQIYESMAARASEK